MGQELADLFGAIARCNGPPVARKRHSQLMRYARFKLNDQWLSRVRVGPGCPCMRTQAARLRGALKEGRKAPAKA